MKPDEATQIISAIEQRYSELRRHDPRRWYYDDALATGYAKALLPYSVALGRDVVNRLLAQRREPPETHDLAEELARAKRAQKRAEQPRLIEPEPAGPGRRHLSEMSSAEIDWARFVARRAWIRTWMKEHPKQKFPRDILASWRKRDKAILAQREERRQMPARAVFAPLPRYARPARPAEEKPQKVYTEAEKRKMKADVEKLIQNGPQPAPGWMPYKGDFDEKDEGR